MQWTVRYYLRQSEIWKERSNYNFSPGAMAYAARLSTTWLVRASTADKEFKLLNKGYVGLI
jgi:hypothetical protein